MKFVLSIVCLVAICCVCSAGERNSKWVWKCDSGTCSQSWSWKTTKAEAPAVHASPPAAIYSQVTEVVGSSSASGTCSNGSCSVSTRSRRGR